VGVGTCVKLGRLCGCMASCGSRGCGSCSCRAAPSMTSKHLVTLPDFDRRQSQAGESHHSKLNSAHRPPAWTFKYHLISYQLFCSVWACERSSGVGWSGIAAGAVSTVDTSRADHALHEGACCPLSPKIVILAQTRRSNSIQVYLSSAGVAANHLARSP
jgi:hypothetical protein